MRQDEQRSDYPDGTWVGQSNGSVNIRKNTLYIDYDIYDVTGKRADEPCRDPRGIVKLPLFNIIDSCNLYQFPDLKKVGLVNRKGYLTKPNGIDTIHMRADKPIFHNDNHENFEYRTQAELKVGDQVELMPHDKSKSHYFLNDSWTTGSRIEDQTPMCKYVVPPQNYLNSLEPKINKQCDFGHMNEAMLRSNHSPLNNETKYQIYPNSIYGAINHGINGNNNLTSHAKDISGVLTTDGIKRQEGFSSWKRRTYNVLCTNGNQRLGIQDYQTKGLARPIAIQDKQKIQSHLTGRPNQSSLPIFHNNISPPVLSNWERDNTAIQNLKPQISSISMFEGKMLIPKNLNQMSYRNLHQVSSQELAERTLENSVSQPTLILNNQPSLTIPNTEASGRKRLPAVNIFNGESDDASESVCQPSAHPKHPNRQRITGRKPIVATSRSTSELEMPNKSKQLLAKTSASTATLPKADLRIASKRGTECSSTDRLSKFNTPPGPKYIADVVRKLNYTINTNWQDLVGAMVDLRRLCQYHHDILFENIPVTTLARKLLNILESPRSALVVNATLALTDLISVAGNLFEPIVEQTLNCCLKKAVHSSNFIANGARQVLETMIRSLSPQCTISTIAGNLLKSDKNSPTRAVAINLIFELVEIMGNEINRQKDITIVIHAVYQAAFDPAAETRKCAKDIIGILMRTIGIQGFNKAYPNDASKVDQLVNISQQHISQQPNITFERIPQYSISGRSLKTSSTRSTLNNSIYRPNQ